MAESIQKLPIPFEPKRQNRWVVRLNDGKEIKEWVMYKASRPRFKKKRLLFGGTYFDVEPMEFFLRDPIVPSTSKCLYNLMVSDKLVDFTLEMLDPTGVVIEKWVILDCDILGVYFGDLDYEKDGIMTCSIIVKPKIAELVF